MAVWDERSKDPDAELFRQSRRRRPTGHGDGVLSLSGGRRWKPPHKAKALKMVGKKVGNPETTKQEDNTSLEETLRAPPARGGEDVVGTRVLRSQTRVSCLGGVPRVACVAFVVVVGTDDE